MKQRVLTMGGHVTTHHSHFGPGAEYLCLGNSMLPHQVSAVPQTTASFFTLTLRFMQASLMRLLCGPLQLQHGIQLGHLDYCCKDMRPRL